MAVTLKDEKTLDTWGIVMEPGAGHANSLSQIIQESIKDALLPGVSSEIVSAQPGMLKGLFGKKREYLMITNEGLKDYRMYIGSRDYGKHLDISWFLTVEPGFFKSAFSSMLANGNVKALSFNLDVFDAQDLRAYVTSVHHCCTSGVEAIAAKIHMDTSKINWQSRGSLQVS